MVRIFYGILFLFFFLLPFSGHSTLLSRKQHVLLITSYPVSQPWTSELSSRLANMLDRRATPTSLDIVSLDSLSFSSPSEVLRRFNAVKPRIQRGYYDLIIAADDDAVELMLNHYSIKPARVPFLFCGYENFTPDHLRKYRNMSGVIQVYKVPETIFAAVKLFPSTKKIVVLSDASSYGRKLEEDLKRKISENRRLKELDFVFYDNGRSPYSKIFHELSMLNANSVVLVMPQYSVLDKGYLSNRTFALDLKEYSSRPVFCVSRQLLGIGAIGGYLSLGLTHGSEIAELADRVLTRGSAEGISPVIGSVQPVFDYSELNEYKGAKARLPNASFLVNKPKMIWETHPKSFVGLIAVFVLFFLSALVWFITYRMMTMKNLAIFHALPVRIGIVDSNTKILFIYANDADFGKMSGVFFLRDVSTLNYETVKPAVEEVFHSGRTITIPHNFGESRRTITISKLPKRIFNKEAVIWVSQDNSELLDSQRTLADFAERQRITLQTLTYASEIVGISCYIYQPETKTGTVLGKNQRWPLNPDGSPRSPEEFIYEEDLSAFYSQWKSFLDQKIREVNLTFRDRGPEKFSYYKMLAVPLDVDSSTISRVLVILQDISDITSVRQQFSDVSGLMNSMLDSFPNPIFIKDAEDNFRFTLVNSRFRSFYGFSNEPIIGKTVFELFPKKRAEQYHKSDLHVLRHGSESGISEDIGESHIITNKSLYTRGDGKKLIVGIASDVTELEDMKRKEEESRKILEAIFSNMPDGILIKDPDDDFRYLIWNKALSKQTGVPASEVIGKTDLELNMCPGAQSTFREQDEIVMRTGLPYSAIEEFRTFRGTPAVNKTVKMPITMENGKKFLLGFFVDITKERKLEKEREELIRKLNNYVDNERIINTCLSKIVFEDRFDKNLEEIFSTIFGQIQCDRVWFAVYEEDEPGFRIAYELRKSKNVLSLKSVHDPAFIKQFLDWRERFVQDRLLVLSDIVSSPYASMLAGTDGKSLICAPVHLKNKLFGIIGVGFTESVRGFSEVDERIMRSAAKIVELAKNHELHRNEIVAAHQRSRLIFDNIEIPIWLYDKFGNLQSVNPSVTALAGKSEKEILSIPCQMLFCGGRHAAPDCPVMSSIESKRPEHREFLIGKRNYIISAKPVFDKAGNLESVIKSAFDVTEINETRRKLEAALVAAQAADRAKSYFIATMSHELRTPLNAVIGFSELLQDLNISEEKRNEYLQSINFSGNALLNLVNDILDLSKLEAGQMRIKPELVDFSALCREISAIFSLRVSEKNLLLKLSLPCSMPMLYVDKLRFKQVILNLVGNAVKFTQKGFILMSADLKKTDSKYGVLTFSVSDTGPGVKPEFQEKIFEPFVQQDIHISDTSVPAGTGLGLPISRRLIEKMGGEFQLKSEYGKGATFTIVLKNVEYSEGEPLHILKAASNFEKIKDRHFRVLIVDDVPINLKVLGAMLLKCGCECKTASSPFTAFRILETWSPEFILTDMWMPDMNGEQFARKLRENPKTSSVKIVAVTADIESDHHFDTTFFDRILFKPVTLEKLHKLFLELF